MGVIVGEPTGLSLKAWQSGRTALDSCPFTMESAPRVKRADSGGDPRVGIRFPLGLDYLFGDDPLDMFFEVVPILEVAPDSDVSLNASVGMRYWP